MRTAFKLVLLLAALYAAYLVYMRYFYYRMEYSGGSSWPYSWRCGSYEGFVNNSPDRRTLMAGTDTAQAVADVQTYLNNSQYSSMAYSHNSAYPKQLPPAM